MPETHVHADSAPLLPPPYARLVVVKSFNAAHLGETFMLGKPEQVAGVVAFLEGLDGAWTTGQILDASGGTKL